MSVDRSRKLPALEEVVVGDLSLIFTKKAFTRPVVKAM
jgi:hypothetical protein